MNTIEIKAAEARGLQSGLREARDVLQKYGDDKIKEMLNRMDAVAGEQGKGEKG